MGGVHFMPVGPAGQELAKEILKYHLLPALINVPEEIQDEERLE